MKPGRRPAAEVRAAILTAAGSLLFEEGISGVTFPDTGSVLADLRAQLHAFVDVLMDQARAGVIAGLIGAARTDPELARDLHVRHTDPDASGPRPPWNSEKPAARSSRKWTRRRSSINYGGLAITVF